MDFNQYVKDDILEVSYYYYHTNITMSEYISALISFLQSNTHITRLNSNSNKVGYEGAIALAKLKNLTELSLHYDKIGDEGAIALAESLCLKNVRISLKENSIGNKGMKALAESENHLEIDGYVDSYSLLGFYEYLKRSWSEARAKSNGNVGKLDEDTTKSLFFDLVRQNHHRERIELLLNDSDKYPFLINSKDSQGHTLSHFYTHSPEMQKFLFEHGMIPEQERNQRGDDARIARDSQSVHASPIVKRTNFFTRKLVESMEASKEQLERAAVSYVGNIGLLKQYQNDPIYVQSIRLLKGYQNQNDSIKLRLLSLTDNEKRSVMKETLRETDPTPGDEEFIKTVIDKAEQALKRQYLKKNCHGEYDEGYPTNRMQYDYARDDAKITIPESIGYIKLLIDNFSVPLKEKKELLVALMEQNPDLVKNKLSKVKEKLGNSVILDKEQFNKTELHGLLNGIDDGKEVDKLFKEISGLDIEKVWREQKEFVLLKQIYIAATTYGENSSACIQGTWTQIISSIEEISSEIVKQYDCCLEEEQKLEAQKDVITEENITPFVENLAKKLIQYVEDNPESKEVLQNHLLYLEHIDVDDPEKVTFEQQKILAKINQEFTANITKLLVNYGRSIPKEDEYKIIIKELFETEIMKDFALEKDDQPQILTQSNIKDLNQPAKQSQSVYSKIGIGCGVVIGIAGVALGIAIAVHLEMLAVGIAVGAICCLIAAAIYYCNQPSKSLENSNVQGFSGEDLQPGS